MHEITDPRTWRHWTYVRDDKPFAGEVAPAALFYDSPNRGGEHPEKHLAGYTGLMQADAFSGYNRHYVEGRTLAPLIESGC